jgi:hypothetical protein
MKNPQKIPEEPEKMKPPDAAPREHRPTFTVK